MGLNKRLALTTSVAGGGCTTDTPNLVATEGAFFQFDGNTYDEISGNSPTGSGYSFVSGGKFGGQCIYFNGAFGSYVELNTGYKPPTGLYSISFWLQWGGSQNTGIMSTRPCTGTTTNPQGFDINTPNFYYVEYISARPGSTCTRSHQIPSPNTTDWYHYVFVQNGSDFQIYFNGSLAHNQVCGISQTGHANNIRVGGVTMNKCNYGANFKMSQLRIMPSAINATQVATLYNEVGC